MTNFHTVVLQGDSYSRPTVTESAFANHLPHHHPNAHHSVPFPEYPVSAPHPNSARQPVATNNMEAMEAMEELYELERSEAIRRAEFEAKRSATLRRAAVSEVNFDQIHQRVATVPPQYNTRRSDPQEFQPSQPHGEKGGRYDSQHRLTRSAHASPISTPTSEINPHSTWSSSTNSSIMPAPNRRFSGPSSHFHHHHAAAASGSGPEHLVDRAATISSHHGHGHASHGSHPYAHAHTTHRRAFEAMHDDSPSPSSTDSEPLPPPMFPASHTHSPKGVLPRSGSTGSMGVYNGPVDSFTPSTSPFLGSIRTLGIHSAAPSRAPSPVHLPPLHMNSTNSSSGSSRQPSPTQARAFGQVQRGTGGINVASPNQSPTLAFSNERERYSLDRTLPPLPTPALSSGSSSTGSSPGTHHLYPLNGQVQASMPPSGLSNSTSRSSSRAPSPGLEHSVRAAFGMGMTPIRRVENTNRYSTGNSTTTTTRAGHGHSQSSGFEYSRSVKSSADLPALTSLSHTPHNPSSHGSNLSGYTSNVRAFPYPKSVPSSRPASPPITLPPLLLKEEDGSSPTTPSGGSSGPGPIRDRHHHHAHKRSASGQVGLGLSNNGTGGVTREPRDTVKTEKVSLPHFHEIEAAVAADHQQHQHLAHVHAERGLGLMELR